MRVASLIMDPHPRMGDMGADAACPVMRGVFYPRKVFQHADDKRTRFVRRERNSIWLSLFAPRDSSRKCYYSWRTTLQIHIVKEATIYYAFHFPPSLVLVHTIQRLMAFPEFFALSGLSNHKINRVKFNNITIYF